MLTQKQTVLGLYKSLLQVAKQYPADPLRPSRNLKEHVLDLVRLQFRKHKNADRATSKLLIDYGQNELNSIKSLLKNEFYEKYPRRQTGFPTQLQRARKYLSTKQQQKRNLFARWFGSNK